VGRGAAVYTVTVMSFLRPNPDIERWNRKYQDTAGQGRGVGVRAEPELVAHESMLSKRGLAVDLACGKGENAMHLAAMGYEVVACDFALSGLVQCLPAIRKQELPVYPLLCDITRYPFLPHTFDLVCVVRYLERALFDQIKRWLKPGGMLFYKTFNRQFLSIHPGFNPAYVIEPGELNERFSDFEILASDWGGSEALCQTSPGISFILGRKPGLKIPVRASASSYRGGWRLSMRPPGWSGRCRLSPQQTAYDT